MSEEEITFYVTMKVKAMPNNPIPSVKKMCSGGCGDEVWVDKKLEKLWSKVPVLCLECALTAMESDIEEVEFVLEPKSIESLMKFMINRDTSQTRTRREQSADGLFKNFLI